MLRASEIAPEAYSDDEESEYAEGEGDSDVEDVVDDLTYDVYNLTATNSHTVRFFSDDTLERERVLFAATSRAAQLLVKQ